jgi:hypothetical protein
MADYDFRGLSPSDFETLCHDLLEPELGVKLQGFATGRDKGIDLLHAVAADNTLIVQCKHVAKSGYKSLLHGIKNSELPKIQKLAPKRYVLATTVDLSPGNVNELYELLTPHCISKHDILGATSLNLLLQKHPEVEKANFKLWLTSTAVLQRVLNAAVFFATDRTKEQIRDRFGMFVQTAAMRPAKQQLEQKKVCILSGHPGVGKTTLAEILIAQHLEKGWHLVVVDRNIDEAEKEFHSNPAVKQLFYYDDFLGQISEGEKLGKNEDRALLRMIETVKNTKNRRFLLTTREYILAQAKKTYEQLHRSGIDLLKFVVECKHYSDFDKAKILANHLFFAGVSQGHIANIVSNRTYDKIIKHPNYNPRIIELMTKASRVKDISPSQYSGEFIRVLDNPADIWLHAFENQISEASRHLVLTLASCGEGIVLSDLQKAFESFFLKQAVKYQFASSSISFQKSLFELEDSFIRITAYGKERIVSFQNPSVLDFAKHWLLSHTSHAWDLLESVISFEQAERVLTVLDFVKKVVQGSAEESERACNVLMGTFSSATLRLVRRTFVVRNAVDFDFEWSSVHLNQWDRILVCCRFMKMLPMPAFQDFILESISHMLRQADFCDESVWAKCFRAVSVTFNVAPASWYDEKILLMFDQLQKCSYESVMLLGSFSQLASWIEFNREVLPEGELSSTADKIHKRVVELAERALDNSNLLELEEAQSDLDGIRRSLEIDLTEEADSIEARIQDCREVDGPDSEQLESVHHADGEIDGLFRALVE